MQSVADAEPVRSEVLLSSWQAGKRRSESLWPVTGTDPVRFKSQLNRLPQIRDAAMGFVTLRDLHSEVCRSKGFST